MEEKSIKAKDLLDVDINSMLVFSKTTNMVEDDCPKHYLYYGVNTNPRLEYWISKSFFFFPEFRMKNFIDIKTLYVVKFFLVINKYCLISNSNVNTAITIINNIELSTDSNRSNV